MRTQWTGRYRFTHMEPILILNPRDDVESQRLPRDSLSPVRCRPHSNRVSVSTIHRLSFVDGA